MAEIQSQQEKMREIVVHKYFENPSRSYSSIARELKMNPKTVNRIIKRFKETLTIKQKPGRGRKSGPVDKELGKRVGLSFKNNPGLSQRKRAEKYGTSRPFIQRLMKNRKFNKYGMIRRANRRDKQETSARTRTRKLYDYLNSKQPRCILMDDETYVKADPRQIPGNNFYYAKFRGGIPSKYKYICEDKFAKKYMVWQAICSCGMKSAFFVTDRTMNAEMYRNECLQKRLFPLIRKHNSSVLFWPDLASIHFAAQTAQWYEDNKIQFVENT